MRYIFSILFLFLLVVGCSAKEYCSVLDKRFVCSAVMDLSGSEIIFTKVPNGKFTIGRIALEKSDYDAESKRTDCSVISSNIIEKGAPLKLDCKPAGSGRYTVHMKIYHNEPVSYSPVSGETCLKSAQRWQCDSSAFFTVNI